MKRLQVPFNNDLSILSVYEKYKSDIAEIYFALPSSIFPSARNSVDSLEKLYSVCEWAKHNNILTMALLNGTNIQLTNDVFNALGSTLRSLDIDGVVVSNTILAEWVHVSIPGLKIRLSILSNIDNINKIKEIEKLGYIDEICLPLSYSHDLDGLKELKQNTKIKYSLLVNSSCRCNCPLWGWHHASYNSNIDFSNDNMSILRDTLYSESNKLRTRALSTSFILPEDLKYYDDYINFYKIEDRTETTEVLGRYIKWYCERKNPDRFIDCVHGSCIDKTDLNIKIDSMPVWFGKYKTTCKTKCSNCDICEVK